MKNCTICGVKSVTSAEMVKSTVSEKLEIYDGPSVIVNIEVRFLLFFGRHSLRDYRPPCLLNRKTFMTPCLVFSKRVLARRPPSLTQSHLFPCATHPSPSLSTHHNISRIPFFSVAQKLASAGRSSKSRPLRKAQHVGNQSPSWRR